MGMKEIILIFMMAMATNKGCSPEVTSVDYDAVMAKRMGVTSRLKKIPNFDWKD